VFGGIWVEALALVAAFVIAVITTPAGVSGAVLLLPFQVSVLGTPSGGFDERSVTAADDGLGRVSSYLDGSRSGVRALGSAAHPWARAGRPRPDRGRRLGQCLLQAGEMRDELIKASQGEDAGNRAVGGQDQPQVPALGESLLVRPHQDGQPG